MTVATRRLGRTGRTVSELGLSCTGPWAGRWLDETAAITLVLHALKLGITVFDTGPCHGGAAAQARLGKALQRLGPARERLTISLGVGTVRVSASHVARDFSPATVETQVAESLDRLGMDHVPLVWLDGPEPAHLSDDLLDTLAALKGEGAAGLIGVAGTERQIAAAMATGQIDVILPAYNPVHRASEPLIERAAQAGIGVIATGALARMAFAPMGGDWSLPRTWWYAARRLGDRLAGGDAARAGRYRFLAGIKGWSAAQASLGFVLSHPDVSCAGFATADLRHLHENAAASGRALPHAAIRRIVSTD